MKNKTKLALYGAVVGILFLSYFAFYYLIAFIAVHFIVKFW